MPINDFAGSTKGVCPLRNSRAVCSSKYRMGETKTASLIKACNAFTVQFILEGHPTESIRLPDDPFEGKRHVAGGENISVDDIGHDRPRPLL